MAGCVSPNQTLIWHSSRKIGIKHCTLGLVKHDKSICGEQFVILNFLVGSYLWFASKFYVFYYIVALYDNLSLWNKWLLSSISLVCLKGCFE